MTVFTVPRVSFGRQRWIAVICTLLALLGLAWAARHVWVLTAVFEGRQQGRAVEFAALWAVAFILLAQQLLFAWFDLPVQITDKQRLQLDALRVTVNVPLYNETPTVIAGCVASLFNQSRQPNRIQIVDDGSTTDYFPTVAACYALAAQHPHIDYSWVTTENHGKRRAQLVTFQDDPADIFITVDSDTLLEHAAIEEGLKPFTDPCVQSVAGLYLGLNAATNLITKIAELVCVSWQLVGRSATSTLGNVVVNSGAFALYRAAVIRDNADAYANETFFGRHVPFSDDAHLAMIALTQGKTVQQVTAVSLTLYPECFGQYCRQYARWMRGAFIRAWWRFRYLPLRSYAFWNEYITWVQFLLASIIFVMLYVVWPVVDQRIWIWSVIIPLLLGYAVAARYLLIRRTDLSRLTSFGIYALAPVMILWCWFVCRPIRVWAMLTFRYTGWGTRPTPKR